MNTFIDEKIETSDEYTLLSEEMNKYKTLSHPFIRWADVYDYARNIIESGYFDSRILFYLVLSCVHLNDESRFSFLDKILGSLILNWYAISADLSKSLPKRNEIYKKFFRNFLNELIENINEGKLSVSNERVVSLSELCKELAMLSGDKSIMEVKNIAISATQKTNPAQKTKQPLPSKQEPIVATEKNSDSLLMGEREYRNYYMNIAENLINEDMYCLSPYLLYLQAAWGKISSLPSDVSVLYPDEHLISELNGFPNGDKGAILDFEKNLVLNPFWFEGQLLFLEYLKKSDMPRIASMVSNALLELLERRPGLLKLRFSNEKSFCDDKCYKSISVFALLCGQVKRSIITSKNITTDKLSGFQETIQVIEEKLHSGTISHDKALLTMAEVLFDAGFMSSSALIYKKAIKNIEFKPI